MPSSAGKSPRRRRTSFDADAWLSSLANFEQRKSTRDDKPAAHFGLERIQTLCDKLGDPQNDVPALHVAGTKGKGSTCAMSAAMLRASGLRVGLYTSPHLVDVRERIRVLEPAGDAKAFPQGTMIPQVDFDACIEKVAKAAKAAKVDPTYFDALTAAAFVYFAQEKLDIMVIEVGLGGRLDSTNVLTPLASVITPLSLDHTAQLGPTLAHIAAEKAGIIKPGVTAITCLQPDEATLAVLQQHAADKKTKLRVLGEDIEFTWRFEASRMMGRNNRVGFETDKLLFDHLAVPLLGEHQAVNCGLALAAMDELIRRGIKGITAKSCAEGLEGLTFEGRLEVIREDPMVVADAAHNAAGVEALFRAIGQHFNYDTSVVIFGCCSDKDVDAMLDKLGAGADKVIFCPVESPRSAEPAELQKIYHDAFGRMSQTADSLSDALRSARRSLTDDDLLVITGSFHLVGEAKRILAKKAAARDAA